MSMPGYGYYPTPPPPAGPYGSPYQTDPAAIDMSVLAGQDVSQMTPEQIKQLSSMGALGDEQGTLDKQLEYAKQLRNAPAPEGISTRGGYTAANPLEHLARTAQGIQANRNMGQIQERQGGIRSEQSAGRGTYMQMLLANALKGSGQNSSPVNKTPIMP